MAVPKPKISKGLRRKTVLESFARAMPTPESNLTRKIRAAEKKIGPLPTRKPTLAPLPGKKNHR